MHQKAGRAIEVHQNSLLVIYLYPLMILTAYKSYP